MRIAAWSPASIVLALAAGCGGQSANEQQAAWARDAGGRSGRSPRTASRRPGRATSATSAPTRTPKGIVDLIDEIQESLEDLAGPARVAGLRTCGRTEARKTAVHALREGASEQADFEDAPA